MQVSKTCERKLLRVQVPPSAQILHQHLNKRKGDQMIALPQEQLRQKQLKQKWILQDYFIYPAMFVLLLLLCFGIFLKLKGSPTPTTPALSFICTIFSFSIVILWFVKIINGEQIGIRKLSLKRSSIPIIYIILGFVELADFIFSVI